LNPVNWVARKEIREMLRDKRTRGVALFGPIFLMIFFVCGMGSILSGVAKPQGQIVHFVGRSDPLLVDLTKAGIQLREVASLQAGIALIKREKARLVLDIQPAPKDSGRTQVVYAYFDPKQQKGQIALSVVSRSLAQTSRTRLESYLVSRSLPAEASQPIKIEEKPVKVGEGGAGEFIVGMLPYLIVIWAFYGGFALATDLVSGEKEKATLETLLITPVSRTEIVMGKFLALCALCLVSALSSVLGLVLIGLFKLPGSDFMLQGGLGISPLSALVTVIVLLPTVAMFASLLLLFSTYAKNTREAQSYISLASFVVVVPAAFSQLIGLTDAASQVWVSFVPVLNTANSIRNALLGKTDWLGIGITVGVSGLIAMVLVWSVVRLFNKEEVLTRV